MIAEELAAQAEDAKAPEWCYLVSLSGSLYALPDNDRTVLLPFISSIPQVTPLPSGLVPPYILGLINVAQRGELLIDLPRMLGLRNGPLPPGAAEGRRVLVVGEATPPEMAEYRLAFAVDFGYELLQAARPAPVANHALGAFVTAMVDTPHGDAARLDLEAICNAVLGDLGADRQWNQQPGLLEEDADEP